MEVTIVEVRHCVTGQGEMYFNFADNQVLGKRNFKSIPNPAHEVEAGVHEDGDDWYIVVKVQHPAKGNPVLLVYDPTKPPHQNKVVTK